MKTQTHDKATARPWKQHTDGDKIYANIRANGRCVADFGSRSDEIAQANAALSVKAVNEYEALNAVAEAAQNAFQSGYDLKSHHSLERAIDTLNRLRANQQEGK